MYLTLDDLTPFLFYDESKNSKPLKRCQNKRTKRPERVQKRKLLHSNCPSININKTKNNSIKPDSSNPELQPTKTESCLWPKADIIEYSSYYQMELELPGFKKQDISIDYDNEENQLIIKGTYVYRPKKSEHIVTVEDDLDEDSSSDLTSISGASTSSEGTELLMERKSKKGFNRSFKIEKEIIEKEIKAELMDGVLSLILPKSTMKKNKKIRIDIQ
ncbi:HSP20-like chaperone [Neoconidiobolus thromboides FSU 785]|nr:HSP20-like chaperone [Neoconidiobolus thromboides FSU 785]